MNVIVISMYNLRISNLARLCRRPILVSRDPEIEVNAVKTIGHENVGWKYSQRAAERNTYKVSNWPSYQGGSSQLESTPLCQDFVLSTKQWSMRLQSVVQASEVASELTHVKKSQILEQAYFCWNRTRKGALC